MTCIPYTQTLFQKFTRMGSYFGNRDNPDAIIFKFQRDYGIEEAKTLVKWLPQGFVGDNPNPEPSKLDQLKW